MSLPTILLVDDEDHALHSMRMALEDEFDCLTAPDAAAAMQAMEDHYVQAIFCDQRMPGQTGVEFLSEVRDRWPDVIRIIITGYTETSDMIAAINEAGIYQIVTKPWHPDQLMMVAKNAVQLFALHRDHQQLSLEMRFLSRSVETKLEAQRKVLREGHGFDSVLRHPDSPMNAVIAQARQFATFDVPVLLIGEPGTGKAGLARAMHLGSLRSDRPWHAVNAVGVPDDLLELELFGARRGALPGLQVNRIGLAQKAERGTLYLGGVDSLSPAMQLKLLTLVTAQMMRPLGATEMTRTDVRVMAGSHRDLRAEVAAGRFRADLYYALNAATLTVPPLRARLCDLGMLAEEALYDAATRHGKIVHGLSEDALAFLGNHDWPGNLRELENEMLRMLIFSQDAVLGPELISRHILQATPARADPGVDAVLTGAGTLKDRVEEIEMRILRETLTRLKWNKSRAAAELGLSRVGLRAKIDRYGIPEPSRVEED